jgi:hypothetical protein
MSRTSETEKALSPICTYRQPVESVQPSLLKPTICKIALSRPNGNTLIEPETS